MLTRTIDVQKDHGELKGLLSMVSQGAEIILTDGDRPVARVVPIGSRIAGLHSGSVWTSPEFDEPISEDFWTAEEP
jgi:antitoxin (DNA-binding transcriptional repressor) of toxin-antitoxin stability system